MTDKLGGFLNELRVIEFDIQTIQAKMQFGGWDEWPKYSGELWKLLDGIKDNISSLRSLLAGDVGEDELDIRAAFGQAKTECMCLPLPEPPCNKCEIFGIAEEALSRLSAKAKLGEAEIREAKREVLEKFKTALQVEPDMFDFVDRELAALSKEAGE